MTFLFPSLALLGTLLVLVPLGVHLISRRRRKRIQWSAMEFLLESSRRNRNRSRLEELLLLIMRMLAVALAGLLAAVPQLPQQLSGWFTGQNAKHLVILDDSYSMTELVQGDSPWNSASAALTRLLNQTKQQAGTVHLLRYSDPISKHETKEISSLNEYTGLPSKLAVSATEALLHAKQWLSTNSESNGKYFVTVLSDFRRRDHSDNMDLQSAIESVSASAKDCLLAHCAPEYESHDNRSILELSLLPGPRATGVEANAQVVVANRSEKPASKQTVTINQNGSLLTSLEMGPFQPGEEIARSFPLLFKESGPQVLSARLPDDSLAEDNYASLCLEVPPSRPVLVLTGSPDSSEALAYTAALAPHPSVSTGWQSTVLSSKSFDGSTDLSQYAVLFLLDIGQLNRRATESIFDYVQQGGGVFLALGPNTDPGYFNTKWYESVPGMMPGALDLPTQAEAYDPNVSLLSVSDHSALRVLSGARNGFLPLIRVNRFYGLKSENRIQPVSTGDESKNKRDADLKVLLQLPTGEPLLSECRVGRGRIMTMFTTVAKSDQEKAWSNLATLPVFPVLVNEFASWLSQSKSEPISIPVGSLPKLSPSWQAWRLEEQADDLSWRTLREESTQHALPIVEPGSYQITQLSSRKKLTGDFLFATNTDPSEGELAAVSLPELREQFGEVCKVLPADEIFIADEQGRSWASSYGLTIALLALLILERILAMRCSHLAAIPSKSAAVVPRRKA